MDLLNTAITVASTGLLAKPVIKSAIQCGYRHALWDPWGVFGTPLRRYCWDPSKWW